MYWITQATVLQLCLTAHSVIGFLTGTSDSNEVNTIVSTDPLSLARKRWADAAFQYIKSLNCSSVYFTSLEECNHLLNVHKRNVAVYIAQQKRPTDKKFIASLPDGGLRRAGAHKAVVALDPYPDANFGHLVVVFFIGQANRSSCQRREGIYMGNQECLSLALKHRCKNAIERRWRKQAPGNISARLQRKMIRKCEINFIPHVYQKADKPPAIVDGISQGYQQQLTCRDDLLDYSLCPTLRPANETLELVCNPIRDNTRRCETTHEAVGTRCRMFKSCDQAVLISGGWNRQTSMKRHSENIVNMYHLLRRNGFNQEAIKIFFANGMHRGIQEESGQTSIDTEIFPAAMKTSMRLHIKKLCTTPHCVDTLVLYLNSPSKTDGSMLLWDINKDGKADDSEKYTVDELLDDLRGCKARSVQIIADQSFSGEISRAARKSRHHPNVVAYASSGEHEYSYLSTFTDYWTNLDHSQLCTQNVFQQIKHSMLQSTPEMGTRMMRSNDGPGQVTIFGAPCNVDPPFTSNELKLYYHGCQNVPTEVWVRTFFGTTNSDSQSYNTNSRLGSHLSQSSQSRQLSLNTARSRSAQSFPVT